MALSEASAENSKCVAPSVLSNCLLLSSSIVQNPFIGPITQNFRSPNIIIRELHNSIALTADNCSRFLHLFASENPILKKILCFSSAFSQHLTRISCRNCRSANSQTNHKFAAILPGDSVAGVVVTNGILNFLNIYNTLLVVRLVLTWFPNTPPAIVSPLSTICDPYLNIFRGIIPPLGGTLDLSPILAFLVLNAFTSTAAALPAELPETGSVQGSSPSHPRFTGLTSSQKKWMRRLSGNWSKSSTTAN